MTDKRLRTAIMAIGLAGCAGNQALSPIGTSTPDPAPHQAGAGMDRKTQGLRASRMLVVLRDAADMEAFTRRAKAHGARIRGTDPALGLVSVEGASPEDLASDPAVSSASHDEPRLRVRAAFRHPGRKHSPPTPLPLPAAEPFEAMQWGLDVINVRQAWATGASGKGIRVAVVDSGIDADNPDLAPNLDLKHSKSFVPEEGQVDLNGHGSHVAGIIAAARNDLGVVGVAPEATLISVKVLNKDAYGDDFAIIQGLRYAADLAPEIINLSLQDRLEWGTSAAGQATIAYQRAVRYAARRGALVVAGTGNDAEADFTSGWVHLPADLRNVVGVSAVGPVGQQAFDAFAIYSNYGLPMVDLAAPGGGVGFDPATGPQIVDPRDLVFSTWSTHALPHEVGGVPLGPMPWSYFAGTSMACAHVSGVAALAIQAYREPPAAIRQRLERTARGTGLNPFTGHGIVDAAGAVGAGR